MIKVAIVEDDAAEREKLKEYFSALSEKKGEAFRTDLFTDAVTFLTDYKASYDIVFMDIMMPYMDGITAAGKLREMDRKVILFFITNMTQYAVKGYAVDALDYIIKPLAYGNFEAKMEKALEILRSDKEVISIAIAGGLLRIYANRIRYIESNGHKIIYHTETEDIQSGGLSLTELEERLAEYGFLRCNSGYLVNVRHIRMIRGFSVTLQDGTELQISRPRKKKFLEDTARFLGSGY